MLMVTVGGQQYEMSPEAQLERTMILGAIATALVALVAPFIAARFCPISGLDSPANMAVLYAMCLGMIFGGIAGLMVITDETSGVKNLAQVLLILPVMAGMFAAGVLAGARAIIFPFCLVGAGSLIICAVAGKVFKI